jgi:NitT/TauT family transport system substrate-binding protein
LSKRNIAILCFFLLLTLTACSQQTSSEKAGSQGANGQLLTKIRIGFNKSGGQTPQYVADTKGFFEKHGLKVERTEFTDNSKMVAAIQSGELDIMASIPAAVLSARDQGFDLVTFMQNETAKMQEPDSGAILVNKNSRISSLKDLQGKKIGVLSKGSQASIDGLYVIKKAGVDLGKVTLISAPFASHFDLLKSNQVDATITVDPFTTQIMESGIGKVLAYNYIDTVPGQPLAAWWAKKDWVQKNPQAVEAFSLAIKDAIDYLHADENRARQVIAEYTGLDPKLLEKMPMLNWNYKVDPNAWNKENEILLEMGAVQKMPKPDDYFADHIKKYFIGQH